MDVQSSSSQSLDCRQMSEMNEWKALGDMSE